MGKTKRRNRPALNPQLAAAYGVKLPAPPTDSGKYLSPSEIARLLNVTASAVTQWIYHHKLLATKCAAGGWIAKLEDVKKFMAARVPGAVRKRCVLFATAKPDMVEFQGKSFESVFCRNQSDALLKANEMIPALVIIDLAAEELEPWRLAEKLRRLKKTKDCPLLLVGDGLTETELDKAAELKAKGIVSAKDSAAVLAEIERLLG